MVPATFELSRRYAFGKTVLASDSLALSGVIDDIILLETCPTDTDRMAGVLYLPRE